MLHLQSGRKIKSDLLLWANGRTGNSDGMNLGSIGLTANSRGQLAVNEHYCTSLGHVYAVGDIADPPTSPAPAMCKVAGR